MVAMANAAFFISSSLARPWMCFTMREKAPRVSASSRMLTPSDMMLAMAKTHDSTTALRSGANLAPLPPASHLRSRSHRAWRPLRPAFSPGVALLLPPPVQALANSDGRGGEEAKEEEKEETLDAADP